MLQLPDGVILSNVNVIHEIPNFKTTSMNRIVKVKGRGIHVFKGNIDVTIGGDVRTQKRYNSFLTKAQGSLNPFELDLSMHFKSEHMTENPTTLNAIDIGATKMTLGTFVGEVYEGSYFTLPNDSKIYVAQNDATSGQELSFFPAARQSVLQNGEINFISPVIKARFVGDVQSQSMVENGLILEATLDWEEAM